MVNTPESTCNGKLQFTVLALLWPRCVSRVALSLGGDREVKSSRWEPGADGRLVEDCRAVSRHGAGYRRALQLLGGSRMGHLFVSGGHGT